MFVCLMLVCSCLVSVCLYFGMLECVCECLFPTGSLTHMGNLKTARVRPCVRVYKWGLLGQDITFKGSMCGKLALWGKPQTALHQCVQNTSKVGVMKEPCFAPEKFWTPSVQRIELSMMLYGQNKWQSALCCPL